MISRTDPVDLQIPIPTVFNQESNGSALARGFAVDCDIVVRLARCETAFNYDWTERLAKAAGMPAPETELSRGPQGHGASV